MVERRGTVRAIARIEVFDDNARVERVPLFISGNVSSGGIFLITNEPYKHGTNMKISFSLPCENKPIQAEGCVVWKRRQREQSDRQPGMGVQFMKIDKEDREKIREFVAEQVELGNIDEED